MLNPSLIPTPLVQARERRPIPLTGVRVRRLRGLFVFLAFCKTLIVFGWLRLRGQLTGELAGQLVRHLLEEQGFLWVKLGQVLSLRSDLFSADFCRELSKLQFQVRGFPYEQARQTLDRDLRLPFDQIFTSFEERPFAAASISQVHRAVLRERGTVVVVKIQRPEVPAVFASDMALLRGLINTLRWLNLGAAHQWDELIDELTQIVDEEIDYRYEMSNLRRMRKSLRAHRIYVPRIFDELCSPRVLIMEYIDGALMSDFIALNHAEPGRVIDWLHDNNIDPGVIGRRLFQSFMRQLFEDNLLHGDLHPGNIILLRDNHVAFIDLGTIGILEAQLRNNYLMFLQSLSGRHYTKAADVMLLGATNLPPVNLAEVKEKLVRCFYEWGERSSRKDVPYRERSMENLGVQSNQILLEKGITISLQYMKIGRTLGTMDASLANLIPDAHYTKLMRGYFRGAQQRAKRPARRRQEMRRMIWESFETADEASGLLQVLISRKALHFEGSTSRFGYLQAAVFRALRLGAALVGVAWLLRLLEPGLLDWPALAFSSRFAHVIPAPADPSRQAIGVVLAFAAYLWCRRNERWWLEREARLPDTLLPPPAEG